MKLNKQTIFHDAFEVGVLIKFLHGLAEMFGGLTLLSAANWLGNWLYNVIYFELTEDPGDWLANKISGLGDYLIVGHHLFPIIYLFLHAGLNIFLAICLWRKKLWSYPLTIGLLVLFSLYQIYRYFIFYSPTLLVVTLVDIFVIGLTWAEYKRLLAINQKQN